MASVVLVTGVSRFMGGAVSQALSRDPSIERIIGVDVIPPPHSIGRAEFVRADIRNPMIGKIIAQAHVDTVVHMNVIATPVTAGGRSSQKEINVIGTMQLLAACQKASSLQRLVVKSSATVYGSSPRDPAMFTEDMVPKAMPRAGFGRDSAEVEGYVRGFSRRRPEVGVAMLRFANIIGPGIRTELTDYFSLPVVPVPFGFDARLQFVHEADATSALVAATISAEPCGIVNVAGDGMISVLQAAALVRRPVLPLPFAAAGLVGGLVKRLGRADFSADQMEFLAHGRGIDTTRMRRVLRFEPAWTTRQAFSAFADHVGGPVPGSDLVGQAASTAVGSAAAVLSHALSPAPPVRPACPTPPRPPPPRPPPPRPREGPTDGLHPRTRCGRRRGCGPSRPAGRRRPSGDRRAQAAHPHPAPAGRRRRDYETAWTRPRSLRRRPRGRRGRRPGSGRATTRWGRRSSRPPEPGADGRLRGAGRVGRVGRVGRAVEPPRLGPRSSAQAPAPPDPRDVDPVAGRPAPQRLPGRPAGAHRRRSRRGPGGRGRLGPSRRTPLVAGRARPRPDRVDRDPGGLGPGGTRRRRGGRRPRGHPRARGGHDPPRHRGPRAGGGGGAAHGGLGQRRRARGGRAAGGRTLAFLRRRLSGDFTIDEFGFDADFTDHFCLPLLRPLYRSWFRVEVRGVENLPAEGGGLVVANHSGTIPVDSLMTQVAVHDEHPQHRHLRMLGADLVFSTPVMGQLARKSGSTLATSPDAERLLRGGELVGVWPEGFKGVGKPFSERYKLQRFGRGGFVSAAISAGVPIIPCSIVGAEEIYPLLGNIKALARLVGAPYAPVTPTWPLLGPLGLVPLPSKWIIEFGVPVQTARPRGGGGRRPDARLRPHRPDPRDHPADALLAAHAAPVGVLLTWAPSLPPGPCGSPSSGGPGATCATTRGRSWPRSPPTSGWAGRSCRIDDDPQLRARYADQIPVTLVDGAQHDFWRVSEQRLRSSLAGPPRRPPAERGVARPPAW